MSSTDWLTLALVLITAFYAWATYRILRANEAVVRASREQTEVQLRPYIVVSAVIRTGTTLVSLEVRNTGKSPATKVRLRLDRDFYADAGRDESKNIAKLPAFTSEIEAIAPGARMLFTLGVGGTIFGQGADDSRCPPAFQVAATYNFGTKQYQEENHIDIRPLLRSSPEHDPVADELELLRKAIEKLASHRG